MPRRAWQQRWKDVLFLHWPIESRELRAHIPAGLELQEWDGAAWVGLVPFVIDRFGLGVGPRFRCNIPEINLRTYVQRDGKPGVWFFNLDITSPLAMIGGRLLYHVNYRTAPIQADHGFGGVRYQSAHPTRLLSLEYSPTGLIRHAVPGSWDPLESTCRHASLSIL